MSEAFGKEPFFLAYVKWHYGQGFREFFEVIGNFFWFIGHFFSFRLFLKTWFSPWKRLGEHYEGGLDLSAFASVLVVNTLMRMVGFVVRTAVMFIGVVSCVALLASSFLVLLIWILAPAIFLGSIVLSATFFVV